ncbi:GIN domain-containing protein [Parahaliea aestuarii]|uniref:DUF2807 domain-containing protein n=1 Tax=Parahaliea aestuarii TaxID=1852021 RepID=A0A5C8ZUT4_9GAMM|nr:DUF2807 domain-containing protein [Parahaliea aestuarii]TXS91579.1 DUF2807 domain-containing protein [Parahaliea aestuarii]
MPRYCDHNAPRWKGGPMLKGSLAFLALALASTLLSSAASAEETRRVEGLDFDAVMVYGDVEVEISQGDTVELLLRGDREELDLQPFLVDGTTLLLGGSRESRRADFDGVKFRLTTPTLEHLEVKGSGDVYVQPFTSDSLFVSAAGTGNVRLFEVESGSTTLQLSGSGRIQLARLTSRELKVALSGSGDIQLGEVDARGVEVSVRGSGDISLESARRADNLELSIVGSGDVDFRNMDSGRAEVNIVGSGDARIGEIEVLEVNILGSGDVVYRGSPVIEQDLLIGSGDLRRER